MLDKARSIPEPVTDHVHFVSRRRCDAGRQRDEIRVDGEADVDRRAEVSRMGEDDAREQDVAQCSRDFGITEDQLKQSDPAAQQKIEEKIRDMIKQQAENGGDKRTGLITDKSATSRAAVARYTKRCSPPNGASHPARLLLNPCSPAAVCDAAGGLNPGGRNHVGTSQVRSPSIFGQRRGRGCRAVVAQRFGLRAGGEAGPRARDQAGRATLRLRGSSRSMQACSTSGTPKPVRPTVRRSSCCTAGPTTSTVTSTSPRCWPPGLPRDRAVPARLRHHAFRSDGTIRNGQQAALARRRIALMDALKIPKAVIGGFDWGARTANASPRVAGTLQGDGFGQRLPDQQPGRRQAAACRRSSSCSGGINSTLPPSAVRAGYAKNTRILPG